MEFNVAQLLKEPIGSIRQYTVNTTFDRLADTGTNRVTGKVTMMRTDRDIWVTGTLEATSIGTCSRCLAPTPHQVPFQLDEMYVPTVDIATGTPMATSGEKNGSFTINQDHTLNLLEAVRQYTIMHVPMKPLCRSDCAGICQRCGVNLNEGECQCAASTIDPQWAALGELLVPEKNRKG